EAETTYGIIGVKVWIYKGIVFEKEKKKNEDTETKNINEKENVTTS
ncbi:MAG: 30S ribosomal protein S3, partial [Candidatus Fonsibacter ubiquis]